MHVLINKVFQHCAEDHATYKPQGPRTYTWRGHKYPTILDGSPNRGVCRYVDDSINTRVEHIECVGGTNGLGRRSNMRTQQGG